MNGWVSGDGGTILHTIDGGGIVSVEEIKSTSLSPEDYLLFQNYPNPFNPITTIKWYSPVSCTQTLRIFDVLGNEVKTLVDEERAEGNYEIEFDASSFSSGIYFYQLKAGSFIQTRKMILIK